ncbi:NUDIX domain-containing protein [Fredinandcohnia sp. 179-A 10B2 NHS]|uniref:NUDIX domain-containing protein n=1 Tax=Fredinandcohnia sp. 179-A 10B2 NHS TaxID=3235176 RepID=UPI0039A01DC5
MKYPIRVRACALIIENDSILLVEFDEPTRVGIHYNLPAGGVEPGETIIEAVKREAWEEASVDVEVGKLAFVSEYVPSLNDPSGPHGLSLMFDCKLKNGSMPKLPKNPDPNQIGVRWVPLNQLDDIVLFPNIKSQILEYCRHERNGLEYIEEHLLPLQQ